MTSGGDALQDQARQRANRIALWRSQILDAERDGRMTPLAALLDAFEADVRADAAAAVSPPEPGGRPAWVNGCDVDNTNGTVRHA